MPSSEVLFVGIPPMPNSNNLHNLLILHDIMATPARFERATY